MQGVLSSAQIIKIERRPCNTPVYNLAVEEDESYIANDVVVHNCRSILVPITTDDLPFDSITREEADRALALTPEDFGGRVGGITKPVKEGVLGDIITGSKVKLPDDILKHYRDSANAAEGIYSSQRLKAEVAERLGNKMDSLNMPEWKKFAEGMSLKGDSISSTKNIIRQWAETSGDTNPRSIMMQLAAEKEFGLKGSSIWWDKTALAEAKTLFETHEVAARRFLREMYNDTQAYLKSQGLKTVRVARGYVGDIGIAPSTIANPMSKVNIKLQPMSSFSGDTFTAKSFAGIPFAEPASMLFAEIPVNRVLSCPVTGYGCKAEFEYVILGSQKAGKETVLASMIEHKQYKGGFWELFKSAVNEEQIFKENITKAIYGATK